MGKKAVMYEALELMGISGDDVIRLNKNTFTNKSVKQISGERCFSCSYGDYGWVMDEPTEGISWDILGEGEVEDGSVTDINSPEAYNEKFAGGLKNFNRRKFYFALEKLTEVIKRCDLYVNIIFAVSETGDSCKSEVVFVQITDYDGAWVL